MTASKGLVNVLDLPMCFLIICSFFHMHYCIIFIQFLLTVSSSLHLPYIRIPNKQDTVYVIGSFDTDQVSVGHGYRLLWSDSVITDEIQMDFFNDCPADVQR